MRKNSITLHPKHGANPMLDVCFWTGEALGVALLGFNKGREAPRMGFTSYNPGPKAKALMEKGITLIEVVPSATSKLPEIAPGLSPTGRWIVVTDGAMDLFTPEYAEKVREARKAFVDPKVFDMLCVEEAMDSNTTVVERTKNHDEA